MTNFIMRESKQRVDHPERHPDYARVKAVGEKNMREGKLKFENEAQKRDYMRAVDSNPNNVPGIPAFYPPVQIKSYLNFDFPSGEKSNFRFDKTVVNTLYLYCENCRGVREVSPTARVTPHEISQDTCYCKVCGTEKKYRLK